MAGGALLESALHSQLNALCVGKQQYELSLEMKSKDTNLMPGGADCPLLHRNWIGYLPSTVAHT